MQLERLWAPWRLDYIKNPERPPKPNPEECFLCQYRDKPEADSDNFVILRTDLLFVVLNRFPYNNGHLLVAPLRHKGRLDELDEPEMLESLRLLRQMTDRLESRLNADGFNIGLNLGRVAGAGVPGHLHWHIVPRWHGDSNFMTVVSDTRVIPQSLRALYEILTTD